MGAPVAVRIAVLVATALLVAVAIVTDRPDDDPTMAARGSAASDAERGSVDGGAVDGGAVDGGAVDGDTAEGTTTTAADPTTTTEPPGPTTSAAADEAPTGPGAGRSAANAGPPATTAPTTAPRRDPAPSSSPPATTAPDAPVAPAGTDPACERQLVSLTNHARAAAGVPALGVEGGLTSMARRWAQSMADQGALAHNPDRTTQLSAVIPGWSWIGENVAYATSVATIHSNWMASAVHRGNILSTNLQFVGVGCVRDAQGRYWAAQDFAGR